MTPHETVALADLKPHPRNYRHHPEDQLEQIAASLSEHGLYRNVVVARDLTVLAGHGVVEAAQKLKWKEIDVVRLDLDPTEPRALKVLTGDNELGRLAEIDDRLLAEQLKELADLDELLGTGFDEQMLANLVYVTRPSSEIEGPDTAAEWVGMPEFTPGQGAAARIVINFDSREDFDRFVKETGVTVLRGESAWWPARPVEDLSSIAVEG